MTRNWFILHAPYFMDQIKTLETGQRCRVPMGHDLKNAVLKTERTSVLRHHTFKDVIGLTKSPMQIKDLTGNEAEQ